MSNPYKIWELMYQMTPEELEVFTERAGKFEYEAGMTREEAEAMALEAMVKGRGL